MSIHNANQREELTDNLLGDNSRYCPVNYPKILTLISSKEKLYCCIANEHKYPNSMPIIYCFCFIHSGMNLLYCQNVMEHILVN